MAIKTMEQLANMLGMAFAAYANRVENGAVEPYTAMLNGGTAEVVFTVTENGIINIKPLNPIIVERISVVEAPPEEPLAEEISEAKEEEPVEDPNTVG